MSVITDPRTERRWQAIALALIALLFAADGFIVWYRSTYNVFPGQSADSRVHWCNRDYANYGGPAQSLRQVDAAPDCYSLEVTAGACHAGGMLSDAEIDSFVADGFVAVRGAVPAEVLRACQEEVWSALAERGVLRDAPVTWRDPVVRIPCPESEATPGGTSRQATT